LLEVAEVRRQLGMIEVGRPPGPRVDVAELVITAVLPARATPRSGTPSRSRRSAVERLRRIVDHDAELGGESRHRAQLVAIGDATVGGKPDVGAGQLARRQITGPSRC